MYKTTGLTHLINSTKYSLQGLKAHSKMKPHFATNVFLRVL